VQCPLNVIGIDSSVVLRAAGQVIGTASSAGAAGSVGWPVLLFATHLFGTALDNYSPVRLYDLWVDNSAVSDRAIIAYEQWAAAKYGARG
jgi:hypothetical protein